MNSSSPVGQDWLKRRPFSGHLEASGQWAIPLADLAAQESGAKKEGTPAFPEPSSPEKGYKVRRPREQINTV